MSNAQPDERADGAGARVADEIVLSYHDSLLRSSDVSLLRGPHWLNDAVIGFYYEYLTRKYGRDGDAQLLFVNPPLTQLLRMSDSRICGTLLDTVDAKSHHFVFFPVNNCNSRMNAGGTHWTLLVYSRANGTFYHYDPARGAAKDVAFNFATNLIKHFLGKETCSMERRYCEMWCPQQDNSYDCGLHVLCMTDVISRHVLRGSEIKDCDYGAVPEMVRHKRAQLLHLIETTKTVQSNLDND